MRKHYFKDHWLRHKRYNDPNSSLALKGGELHAPALSSMSFTDYLSKCIYFWQRINPGMFSIENKRQEEAQQERNPYIPSPSPSSSYSRPVSISELGDIISIDLRNLVS